MSELFEINAPARRLRTHVERSDKLKPEAARLLEEALQRGELDRGEVARISGLPERSALSNVDFAKMYDIAEAVLKDPALINDFDKNPISPAKKINALSRQPCSRTTFWTAISTIPRRLMP